MTSFAIAIGTEVFSPRSPFAVTESGFLITSVVDDWRGPLRFYLHRQDQRPALVWEGPARRGRYHRVLWLLSPHFREGASLRGGRITMSGIAAWCPCCLRELPMLPVAFWAPSPTVVPADVADGPDSDDEEAWE